MHVAEGRHLWNDGFLEAGEHARLVDPARNNKEVTPRRVVYNDY